MTSDPPPAISLLPKSDTENETKMTPKSDKILSKSDNRVTAPRVTSLYTAKKEVFESDPTRIWTPLEISREIHAKPETVKQAIRRKKLPFIKVGYGLYRHCVDKSGDLHDLLVKSGRVGFENLIYVTQGDTYPPLSPQTIPPFLIESDKTPHRDESQPESRSGYPRHLPTGQEIRWERWRNGRERVSFISNGRPFSPDLLLFLHDQMEKEGFTGDKWRRVSIEVNIDGLKTTITPDSVTLQDSTYMLLKAYNHGMQARYEVADRREASLGDTFDILLHINDSGSGRAAIIKVDKLEKVVYNLAKETKLALRVARNAREKAEEKTRGHFACGKSPSHTKGGS